MKKKNNSLFFYFSNCLFHRKQFKNSFECLLKERNKSYAKATQDIVARNENLMKSTHLLGLKNNQQVLDIIMAKQLSSGTLDMFRLQTLT